ncbi:metal binding domain of Ada-domain-containing protein [Aspergillus pseudoustus]|uniref:Metal binding domain of Ada-domain-containing protein n=1 Tax=Aspergillus pseudoustus TaxID=1810923 RepID=A0ABR4JMS0_9EURO
MAQKQSPARTSIARLRENTSHSENSAATRWQAVVTRDPAATSFVYAVLTTKIYCRPSCAARLARRVNVEFYDTPHQAERAGFRPCKRCKPETLTPVINPQVVLVQRACQSIMKGIVSGSGSDSGSKHKSNTKPTLAMLAKEAGLTPSHFHRVFKKLIGVTPGKYAADISKEITEELSQCSSRASGQIQRKFDAGGGTAGAAVNNSVLWNDFDILLAMEDEYASGHDASTLAG